MNDTIKTVLEAAACALFLSGLGLVLVGVM